MKEFKVGLQLYSVRDKMEKDFEGTLKAVKDMGYDFVEFAGFFGKKAEDVKEILDKYGLTAISVHQSNNLYEEQGEELIDYFKTLGIKYCAIPWYNPEIAVTDKFIENIKEPFSRFSEALKRAGIKLLYHNHDFEFVKLGEKCQLDRMFEELTMDVLNPEFDACWIRYAGEDPCEYLKTYKGYTEILHLKDFVCDKLNAGAVYDLIGDDKDTDSRIVERENNHFKFVPLGSGRQDFPAILAAAEFAGTEYVIVEQDDWYENDSLELARQSREYLKTLGI